MSSISRAAQIDVNEYEPLSQCDVDSFGEIPVIRWASPLTGSQMVAIGLAAVGSNLWGLNLKKATVFWVPGETGTFSKGQWFTLGWFCWSDQQTAHRSTA